MKEDAMTRKHNTCIKILVLLLSTLAIPSLLEARLALGWTYQELFDKADLVVIARRVASKPIEEHIFLLESIKVRGVMTDFQSLLVLKGPKDIATFKLHHYQFESKEEEEATANGPTLIRFQSEHSTCLLFLVKEGPLTYVPVGGQVDPGTVSVLELQGGEF
jgi:hypothetical protein